MPAMITRRDSLEPISFEGLNIYDHTANQATSSSLAVIEVPPGVRHRRAYSERSDKYYYVISGQIHFALDEAEYDLDAGDSCFLPRLQRFCYENTTPQPAVLLLFHTPSFELQSEVFEEDRETI
jgi:mannose-6-phosphate isomerase-like protein (cupin superfamily)